MSIVWHELKKIVLSPVLLGFMVLCLLFNLLIMQHSEYANYIAQVSHETGFVLGSEFDKRVANLESSEHAIWLQLQTSGMIDVFDGYTTGYIAEAYIEGLGLTGMAAALMYNKYVKLQSAVDARFEAGDGMTLYFAGDTYNRHLMLFGVVMGSLLFEGILLAVLIMLLSLGHEYNARTEAVVYATKVGRRVNTAKFIAGIAAGLGAYALITAVTLAIYLNLSPFGGTWGSSVSSGFNFVLDMLGARPFVTWHSFTVSTYLLASIVLSAGLVLCFGLMAYITGLWIRNGYIGFLVLVIFNMALVTFTGPIFGPTMPTFIIALSPIWLSLQQGMWFTDGGVNVLWPHFETLGVFVSLLLLAVLCVWSSARFKRRNII